MVPMVAINILKSQLLSVSLDREGSMNRKAFILPLVLLILALMSGIAVVLGRLSSEKTLSLKNQEGSYYAKEITVTLVDNEENSDSSETGNPDESEELEIYNQTRSFNKASNQLKTITINVTTEGTANKTYDLRVVMDGYIKDFVLNKITATADNTVTLSADTDENTYIGSDVEIGSNGKLTVKIQYNSSEKGSRDVSITLISN